MTILFHKKCNPQITNSICKQFQIFGLILQQSRDKLEKKIHFNVSKPKERDYFSLPERKLRGKQQKKNAQIKNTKK